MTGLLLKASIRLLMFALACVAVLSGCPSPSIVYPTDKVPAHVVGAENWIPISNLDSSWNVEFDQVLVVSSTQLLGIGRVTNTALDTSALIRTTDGGKTWVYAPLIPEAPTWPPCNSRGAWSLARESASCYYRASNQNRY